VSERLDALDSLLQGLTDEELARAWARCMRQLRQRGLVRTANSPAGDYAERICCDRLGLTRMGFSEKSIDALDPEMERATRSKDAGSHGKTQADNLVRYETSKASLLTTCWQSSSTKISSCKRSGRFRAK
jgi:hypothetical protein